MHHEVKLAKITFPPEAFQGVSKPAKDHCFADGFELRTERMEPLNVPPETSKL